MAHKDLKKIAKMKYRPLDFRGLFEVIKTNIHFYFKLNVQNQKTVKIEFENIFRFGMFKLLSRKMILHS